MRRGSLANRQMDFRLGIPLLNALATFRRKQPWPESVRRVGVMCSPALGDTLLFSGALQDIRYHFPEAEIVHFCMEQNLAAAELIPGADRRVVIGLTKPGPTVRQMRAERLDILLDFTSWQRLTAFYSMLAGARFCAGFRTPGQYRSRGYDISIQHRNDQHEVENFRELLRGLGIEARSIPRTVIPGGARPLAHEQDVIVLHLWASGVRSWLREWPEERWIALAHRIGRAETLFVITGAAGDMWRARPFVRKMAEAGLRAETFAGTDGFVSLARLLEGVRVLVSVNTGVMHLGAILGTPTVSINGPNRNGRWGPVGPLAVGVEAPGEGCGYLHLGFNFDGQATDCMNRITVEMVEAAVAQVSPVQQVTVEDADLQVN
ncbi:glycosyltransferase family 9 protein [soil metagenome]